VSVELDVTMRQETCSFAAEESGEVFAPVRDGEQLIAAEEQHRPTRAFANTLNHSVGETGVATEDADDVGRCRSSRVNSESTWSIVAGRRWYLASTRYTTSLDRRTKRSVWRGAAARA
jgi:hypothetical protein